MESETGDPASENDSEREREREDELTLTIYNGIQKGTVGVKDVALWKGPYMAALKVAAVAARIAKKANKKEGTESVVVGRLRRGGGMSAEEVDAVAACASPRATCVDGVEKSEVDAAAADAVL